MIDALRWLTESEAADGPFAAPGFLWLLLLVPVLAAVVVLAGRLHDRRVRGLFQGEIADRVRPRSVRARRTARDALLLLAVAAGIVALAGPRFDKRVQMVEARGVDLVLIVDLSRSMDAGDVDPSRLERARREIFDLIELLEGDKVGLVTFAGGAYPRMPLTQDHEALRMIVSEMSTRDFQAQGSALDEAIRVGAEMLTRQQTSASGKALIVLSDGEIHEPALALERAAAARQDGVRVFTMLVGDAPAPIPLGNGAWQQDRSGRRVLSAPSEPFMRELAQVGGGAFVRSAPSDEDIRSLYQGGVRVLLDAGVRGVRPRIRWRSAWWWPLGLAVGAGLLGAWLGEGRRRWGLAAVAMFAVHLASAPAAFAGTVPEADRAYREGRFDEASRILTELSYERPHDPDVFRRLGAARYRAGDAEGAARAWEQQARLEGRRAPDTLFNLGNAHARAGRYQTAIERYDEVLALGDHDAARRNREVLAAEIERRRAEQPPPEGGDAGDSDQQPPGGDDGKPEQGRADQQGGPPQPGQEGQPDDGERDTAEPDDEERGEQVEPEGARSSSGDARGEPEEGDRAESGDQPTKFDGGEKTAGDDQERLDSSDVGEVRPDEVERDGGPDSPAGAAPGPTAPLTPEELAVEQAERLLDSVEEGRPRITIPGGSGDKPW